MKINTFPTLGKGDLLGVAAPCARFDESRLRRGIACLGDLGFQVRVSTGIFQQKRYLAGDNSSRASVVNQRAGIGVVHGSNLTSMVDADPQTRVSFLEAVTGNVSRLSVPDGICLKPGRARGVLTGGNLATLTPIFWEPNYTPEFDQAVLFLEDVGEPAYKIDRMLSRMKLAGLFENLRGVVYRSFEPWDNSHYLPDIFGAYNIPVLMGLGAGHGFTNLSLGYRIQVDADRKQLHWLTGPQES